MALSWVFSSLTHCSQSGACLNDSGSVVDTGEWRKQKFLYPSICLLMFTDTLMEESVNP